MKQDTSQTAGNSVETLTINVKSLSLASTYINMKEEGWVFAGKDSKYIYMKKEKNPLFHIDFDSVIIVMFVAFFASFLLFSIIIY